MIHDETERFKAEMKSPFLVWGGEDWIRETETMFEKTVVFQLLIA